MPEQTNSDEMANGTDSNKTLNPMSERIGLLDESKLANLIRDMAYDGPQEQSKPDESEEEIPEDAKEEKQSEEDSAEVESDEDKEKLSQEDDSDDTEEVAEESQEEPEDGLPKGVKKRIDKLTAKRRELEEKVSVMEQELNSLKNFPKTAEPEVKPTAENPYLHLDSQSAVEAEIKQARDIRKWCELNPDGAVVTDANGKETEYTTEQIRNIKANAMDAIEEHLPKQLNYVRARQQFDVQAEAEYKWWKDKTSKEYQSAQGMLKAFPELRKFPDYKFVVGDYLRGAAVREEAVKSRSKPTTTVKKAQSQPTRASSAPQTMSQREVKSANAEATFRKMRSTESLKSVILEKFL